MRVNPENDAFGQENLARFLHKESFEVIERDDGYVDVSTGAPAYFARYKDWPPAEKNAIRLARGRVLDVGCGAGRVCLFLQEKGFDVIGIDNSPMAVEVSRRRGVKNARVLPLEEIGTFKPASFETIVMFGNNFGLFGNRRKARRLLKQMHRVTSDSATILAESRDPYRTANPAHLAYHKMNRGRGRMGGQLKIRVRFKEYVGNWFEYLLVSRREMKGVLQGTGWGVKRFIATGDSLYVAVITKEAMEAAGKKRQGR